MYVCMYENMRITHIGADYCVHYYNYDCYVSLTVGCCQSSVAPSLQGRPLNFAFPAMRKSAFPFSSIIVHVCMYVVWLLIIAMLHTVLILAVVVVVVVSGNSSGMRNNWLWFLIALQLVVVVVLLVVVVKVGSM